MHACVYGYVCITLCDEKNCALKAHGNCIEMTTGADIQACFCQATFAVNSTLYMYVINGVIIHYKIIENIQWVDTTHR
jgi:hypothetical protein